ncbi:MAG: MFS transporter [Lachnospiraceae bacterium]|jgi:predicted MFS family arabinose efflux permease
MKKIRRGLPALFVIYILFGFAQASNEYRVLFLESRGMSATRCGWILAGAGLLGAISRPLAGAIADKLHSRRIVYILSIILWIILLALLLLLQQVYIADFLLCAGIVPLLSICEPVTYGMIEASGVQATIKYPEIDYSLIRVALSIGYSLINFLYTPIINRFGPLAPFGFTLFFVVILLILSGSLRHFESGTSASMTDYKEANASDLKAVNEANINATSTADHKAARTPSGGSEKLRFDLLFKSYYLIVFVLLNFILTLGSNTQSYLVFLLNHVELETSLVGVASGIRVVGEIIMMPLIPLIKRKISLPLLQAIACCFTIVQMVLYITYPVPVIIIGGILLKGLAGGIALGTTAVYLRMMAPEGLDTTTLSLSTVMMGLGSIVVNLAGGMIIDSGGIMVLYRCSLIILLAWQLLYFATWFVGVKILKKTPPMPMFLGKG